MTVTSGIVLFVLVWWLVFFAALPFGVRRAGDQDKGHDAGAPSNPRLGRKAAVATGISIVLVAIAWWTIEKSGFSFR